MIAALALLFALLGGCPKDEPGRPLPEPSEPPPPIEVRADAKDLVFSYSTDGRKFETATTIDQIPESARSAVVVTDLKLTPEQRQSGKFVYVADLRKPRADGSYPVAVASRHALEAKITGTSTAGGAARHEVVVYSASWCGVCKKAKRLLDQWGVRYVEKDVEASRLAQQELAQKAASAGIRPSGVPVIDVGGVLLQGLDEATLKDVLEQKGFL